MEINEATASRENANVGILLPAKKLSLKDKNTLYFKPHACLHNNC